jgi:hypothetical protein
VCPSLDTDYEGSTPGREFQPPITGAFRKCEKRNPQNDTMNFLNRRRVLKYTGATVAVAEASALELGQQVKT